jgi:glycosyltransferase involved in cell wall biosynthesis
MTPLLYDNVNTGHHPGYIAGIVEAAEAADTPFVIGSVERPPTLLDNPWIRVETTSPRQVAANRRQLRIAARHGRELGAEVLVDLYLDKQVWSVGGGPTALSGSVHVLHHAEQYSPERRGLAALRTAYLRRTLRQLAERGSPIVVHTNRAAELVADMVPPERLVMAGYPVVPLPARPDRTPVSPVRLLFVGAGRDEKGLDLLLGALTVIPADSARLRIVGRQPGELRSALNARFPAAEAEWVDEYVDYSSLVEEYRAADLAVLPYRSAFSRHGGPSSVLLETLSAGLPVVTTTSLADQLPPNYEGARVADADSAEALGATLAAALAELPVMMEAAREQGPEFIAERHSYGAYWNHLRSAVALVD